MRELWMLLGEKDVQIYQLLKEIEVRKAENEKLAYELNKLIGESGNAR